MKTSKNKAAQELGSLGGKARASRLSVEERQAIAKRAAQERWKDHIKSPKKRVKP